MKNKATLLNMVSGLFLQFCILISGFILPKIILSYFGSEVNGLVSSLNQFLSYITLVEGGIGNFLLLLIYWAVWFSYFREQKLWNSLLLAILPTIIFLLNGITLMHILLIISAVIFGLGHIYITYKNAL